MPSEKTKKPLAKKPTESKSTTNKSGASKSVVTVGGAAIDSSKAYMKYAAVAAQVPAGEVAVCRIDIPLALHNIEVGRASIAPLQARIRKELPGIDLQQMLELPQLGAALLFASEQVATPRPKTAIREDLSRLHDLRTPMLMIAEALSLLGHLPREAVQQIKLGRGPRDAARDGVALAALYRKHAAAIAGKHPFSSSDFDEIVRLGESLTTDLKPGGARKPSAQPNDYASVRDRLYTLLVRRHQELRKVGMYLFGEAEVDVRVPALLARAGKKRSGKSAPLPTPPSPSPPG